MVGFPCVKCNKTLTYLKNGICLRCRRANKANKVNKMNKPKSELEIIAAKIKWREGLRKVRLKLLYERILRPLDYEIMAIGKRATYHRREYIRSGRDQTGSRRAASEFSTLYETLLRDIRKRIKDDLKHARNVAPRTEWQDWSGDGDRSKLLVAWQRIPARRSNRMEPPYNDALFSGRAYRGILGK